MQGEEIVPCIYNDLKYGEGLICLGKENDKGSIKYGYVNSKGEEVIPFIYDTAYAFLNGMAKAGMIFKIEKNDILHETITYYKYGYINQKGETIIPFIYCEDEYDNRKTESDAIINNFGENELICLGKEDEEGYIKYGCINQKGEEVIPFIYDTKILFIDGLAIVGKAYQREYYYGREIIAAKCGVINKKGEVLAPFIYEKIDMYVDDLAVVIKENDEYDEKYGIINDKGEEIIPCIYDYANLVFGYAEAELIEVGKKNEEGIKKYGYINKKGEEIIPCVYDSIYINQDKIIEAKINANSTEVEYFDLKGKKIDSRKYMESKNIDELKLWKTKKRDGYDEEYYKYGYIDKNGKEVIPMIYDKAENFSDGLAEVAQIDKNGNLKYGLINTKGKEVVPCIYDSIYSFNSGLAKVSKFWKTIKVNEYSEEKKYKSGYIDKEGNEVIPCEYEVINIKINEGKSTAIKDGTCYILEVTNENKKWSNSSDWAMYSLNRASEKNLIPDLFNNMDFTKDITREEYASIAINIYDKLIGKEITLLENPFVDTQNIDVIKAYSLGITKGISDIEFNPKGKVTREQMATMLTRIVSLTGIDTNIKNKDIFKDDYEISSWAKDSVYYLYNNSVVRGVGNLTFAPKSNLTIEQAIVTSINIVEMI